MHNNTHEHRDTVDALRTAVETMAALVVSTVSEVSARDEAEATLNNLGMHLSDVAWLTDKLKQLSIDLNMNRDTCYNGLLSETKHNQSTSETYAGWTNRETWATHVWLTNSQNIYDGIWEFCERGKSFGADLREYTIRLAYSRPDMARDVGSIWRVDFEQLATALLEA